MAFREAARLDPFLAPAHYNLGLSLRQIGQIQPAAEAFAQAIRVDADFALAYANLGALMLETNNLEQATVYLERAIELDDELGVAYYNLGLVQGQQGLIDEAIDTLAKSHPLQCQCPRTYLSSWADVRSARQNPQCKICISQGDRN